MCTFYSKENRVNVLSVSRHISVHFIMENYVTSQSQVMVRYQKTSKV
jgi:hypothetical protein